MKQKPEMKKYGLHGAILNNGSDNYITIRSVFHWKAPQRHAYDVKTAKSVIKYLTRAIGYLEQKNGI